MASRVQPPPPLRTDKEAEALLAGLAPLVLRSRARFRGAKTGRGEEHIIAAGNATVHADMEQRLARLHKDGKASWRHALAVEYAGAVVDDAAISRPALLRLAAHALACLLETK